MPSQMSARSEGIGFPALGRRLYGSRQIRLYNLSQALVVYVDAAVDGTCKTGWVRRLDIHCVGNGCRVNF